MLLRAVASRSTTLAARVGVFLIYLLCKIICKQLFDFLLLVRIQLFFK